jgi:hypothetical protein
MPSTFSGYRLGKSGDLQSKLIFYATIGKDITALTTVATKSLKVDNAILNELITF